MDRNSVDWHGSWVAAVTPFDERGAIDEAKFRRNVDLCIRHGVSGVLVGGCTGEFWAMTIAERARVFRLGVQAAAGRVPVIGGSGDIRTEDTIALTEAAKSAGCDGAMVMPPFFVRPSTADIVAHFEAVADAVEIPLLIYNIPAVNVNPITPELASRLADVRTVVAIKESSNDLTWFTRTQMLAGDRIRVFPPGYVAGATAFDLGAAGYFQTFSNYWGEGANDIWIGYRDGDRARAKRGLELETRARAVLAGGGANNGYAAIKAAMNLFGRPGGAPRRPLRAIAGAPLAAMEAGLKALGIARAADERRAAE